jgi:signal transduction histidine kinase
MRGSGNVRRLAALAAAQAKLANLLRESTSERLPTGHWLVICPEDFLGQVADANNHLERLLREVCTVADATATEAAGPDLAARLVTLCEEFTASTSIRCECAVNAAHVRFGSRVCDFTFWAVAELLTNVAKHARASTVRLSSGLRDGGFVFLAVEDDGVGLTDLQRPSPPYGARNVGLWSIEHWLNELDASLEIQSGQGVTVTIVLPPWLAVG